MQPQVSKDLQLMALRIRSSPKAHHINCNCQKISKPLERTTLSNKPLYVPSTETGPPPQCLEVIYVPGDL
ncbi:hypothetical protein DPMN_122139 [Dreissena polymorpha]|uniref:Uncharacterized protein n=1 Tax=Dreissena polymorpha TaxID=45954 RepID=A0A9D4GRC5_DREPO|nr:hypothetical protein DPMN_122139 [Dreissena polymorpha]